MKKPEDILNSLTERIKVEADLRTVYGETRQIGDKTVIPVARVAYGVGAGSGAGVMRMGPDAGAGPEAEPAVGVGGVHVSPVGFLVSENGEINFMPVNDNRRLLMVFGAGVGLGLLLSLGRRFRRSS